MRPKDKGTAAETAVVRYLQAQGALHTERRALSGTQDRGDVAGIPGVVIEVKNVARDGLPGWVDESEVEKRNDGAAIAFVWHKRRGKASPADWFVTMTGAQVVDILRIMGYLPEAEEDDVEHEVSSIDSPVRQFLRPDGTIREEPWPDAA